MAPRISFRFVDHWHSQHMFYGTRGWGFAIAPWEIGRGKPLVILHNFGIGGAGLGWTVPSIASFVRRGGCLVRGSP